MASRATSLCSALVALASVAAMPAAVAGVPPDPMLEGRAVLPVETYAPGPQAGGFFAGSTINDITFPLPGQPVEGFSALIDGREPGEFLAMPDNGFGNKVNSRDFHIRAYFVRPAFKTARGGSGAVDVGDYVEFRDPDRLIGFPIVHEATDERVLTGGDIDPESLRRGLNGDLWVGDEFGPWILHFDAAGVLLDPPFAFPSGLMSPNNPFLTGSATHPNSRGIEAMAMTPNGRFLYAALEGATVADTNPSRRYVHEFDTAKRIFTGRMWQYRTQAPSHLVADMTALTPDRLVVIERDGGLGMTALFRRVYVLDLRSVGDDDFLEKREAVDLTAIPDPNLVSLPAVHEGDLGLGDPFWVMCESVEAVHVLDGERILVGCDNNFPNKGRNPTRADDTELIIVKVPGLQAAR